jgi:hypothetical protein
MMSLTPGHELGARFVLLRRIAEGGTSQVWLAEDRELGRRVALKILDPGLADTPGVRARLQAGLAHARLLDPGQAVEVLGVHEVDGLVLVEMEYLSGGDLGQFRGRGFAVYGRLLVDVAATLATAHERGIVHRDLKCANVLLDGDGRARLADFGLATLAGLAGAGGSPYNMSPQQLRGEPAGPADDLYAFGAMLYELLAGHPPYYPDITRDRVLHDPVPPLVPRSPAPERVRELALRLLSKSAAARPQDMGEVRRELAAALADPEGAIVPPPVVAPPRPPAGVLQSRTQGARARAVLIATAVAVLGGFFFVFVLLPERVAERTAGKSEEIAAATLAEAGRARQAQQQAAEREQARAGAGQARDAFAARLAALESQAAATWAAAGLAAARSQAEAAARAFDLGDFAPARQSWESATAALAAIEAGRPAALAAALAEGDGAIARGDAAAATRAYQRALAMDAGSAAAKRGLERAGRLDEVFALLDAAARDEQAGRVDAALAGYRKALALDGEAPGAKEALARIGARQASDAFAAVMSRGMAAIADGRFGEAQQALEQARALRPGSREVADALDELARKRKATGLQALTDKALAAERAEKWEEARTAWSDVLALEPTLAPAREGLDRATPRARLDARIDALIAGPQKLWGQAGQLEAEDVLARVAAAAPPNQLLARRGAQLASLLQAARTPVTLRLESDGVTDVVIYRVGRIGAFERRDVEVLPGRYAVVGTRRGFRDVRREVEIPPGSSPDPVVVRCEEPI